IAKEASLKNRKSVLNSDYLSGAKSRWLGQERAQPNMSSGILMEYAKAKTASREHARKSLGRSSLSTAAPPKAENVSMNRSVHAAKAAKQDEFYTQYVDIQ